MTERNQNDILEEIRDLSSKEHGCVGDPYLYIETWSEKHIEGGDIIGIEFSDGSIQKCLVLNAQSLPNGVMELILETLDDN